jgi:hypothetical protein|tara:strand:+ start:18538 stop:18741 length:204 start_codon:yes stop_codon:yes gene_type:complete
MQLEAHPTPPTIQLERTTASASWAKAFLRYGPGWLHVFRIVAADNAVSRRLPLEPLYLKFKEYVDIH